MGLSGAPGGLGFPRCCLLCPVNDPASGMLPLYTFMTEPMHFHVDIFPYCWLHQSLYHNPCRSRLELKCDFDEQASDSLQLSILESLLRSVCKKPNQRLSRARHQMCNSMSVLQPSTLGRNCTEHKPGYLHAATQWTHTATTATPANSHECDDHANGTYFYDFYVKFLHFDPYVGQECYCKTYYILKSNPQNCIFLVKC